MQPESKKQDDSTAPMRKGEHFRSVNLRSYVMGRQRKKKQPTLMKLINLRGLPARVPHRSCGLRRAAEGTGRPSTRLMPVSPAVCRHVRVAVVGCLSAQGGNGACGRVFAAATPCECLSIRSSLDDFIN